MTTEPTTHAETFTAWVDFPHDNLEINCDATGCDWVAEFPGPVTEKVRKQAEAAWNAHLAAPEGGVR